MNVKQLFSDNATLYLFGSFVLSGGFFLFMTRWRGRYLKFVAAEHRFIRLLGFSERTFASTRRLEESRGYIVAVGILALVALAFLIVTIALRIHYGSHWPSDSANKTLEPTAVGAFTLTMTDNITSPSSATPRSTAVAQLFRSA
jgi:hypothetical protein